MKHFIMLSIITASVTAALIITSFWCTTFSDYGVVQDLVVKGAEGAAFWTKVFFSATFTMSALYIVLSKRFDDETKKWAFSVLTLVAGVWIGSLI